MHYHRFTLLTAVLISILVIALAVPQPAAVHAAPAYFPGGIVYVNKSASGTTQDGTSWANAFKDLQSGINAASAGDEVWVATGTYSPGSGAANMFTLKSGVEIYGGFPGNTGDENNFGARSTDASLTTLDGANVNNHVVYGEALSASTILDGFTITGGNGVVPGCGSSTSCRGGGMYLSSSSPILNNLIFKYNNAIHGGGLFNQDGSPVLTKVFFINNTAQGYGGGMRNNGGTPSLTNVVFANNSVTVINSPSMVEIHGGGLANVNSNLTLTNVLFNSNDVIAEVSGTGEAKAYGGGVDNSNGSPTLINVTFYANSVSATTASGTATALGGGVYSSGTGTPVIRNSILWGNLSDAIGSGSSVTVTYSDVQGGFTGTGNLNTDPLFVNASSDDLRLVSASPLVDAGNDTGIYDPDLAGNVRKVGLHVDMGAYEVQAANLSPTLSGTFSAFTMQEDATSNPGVTVSSLLSGHISDLDGPAAGMAVYDVYTANGSWQYSTDGGGTWNPFGTLSQNAATLLGSTALLRFAPNLDWNTASTGPIASALSFRAWDGADGRASGTTGVDITWNGSNSAFSAATGVLPLTVTAVNDPPVNTQPPSISGINSVGQTLTRVAGIWNDIKDQPSAVITLTYQWQAADDSSGTGQYDILGATGTSYAPTLAKWVRVKETASDNGIPGTATADAYSAWLAPVKADQTISFTPPASKNYGDTDFTISATATSGLPVAFNLKSGPCIVTGTTVHITGVGSCVITATQDGDANYNQATPVDGTITINKGSQTITFAALANQTYGVADFTVSATASSNLAVTFNATGDCMVTGDLVHLNGAGSCTVTASQAGNANYNPAPDVPQSFTIAKANQTITFGALANQTYGVADFPVSATASSGLAVIFTATGDCTVAGATVHITGAGSCTITAKQAGNTNYNPATDVPQTFTIAKADQTITFGALANQTYGVADFAVSATASSGLPVTFTATGDCTVTGAMVRITGVGSCTITAKQAGNTNYNPAPDVLQTFTIGKGDQTITFGALANKTFGDSDFTVSATASSGLAVTFTATGDCTVLGNSVHIAGAGSCTITAKQAGDANYNPASDVPQSFTIAKANQTITFAALADKTILDPDFAVSASATSNLPVMFTATGDCTVTGNLVHIAGAGSCTITAKQAGNTNYNPAPDVPRTFTITKANQTITFGSLANKTFGDQDFTVSATASSNLAVTFTATGDCTVTGDLVHLSGAGSCTITAKQAGDASYNPATDVPQSFTIAKASQTITFGALANQTYGVADFPVSATVSSGLAVTFTATGNCTVAGATVHIAGAGSCTITAKQAGDTNYNPAPDVPQSFTIAKADQTINFAALPDKTSADPDFTVSATASSGLPVAFSATGSCTMPDATTVHITGFGSCTITASQTGNSNYNAATPVDQTFQIRTNQTITFDSLANKTYGDADFVVSATASSGLTVAFVAAGDCTLTGTTVHITGAGSCTITASQAGNTNYNAAPPVDRTFTIAKADQTITFDALANKTIDDPDFTLTATASSGLTVTFLASGPCEIVSANQVHLTGAGGTCTITAQQAGDANYNTAADVPQSFTVASNHAPVVTAIIDQKVDEKTTLSLTVEANDSLDTPANILNFSLINNPPAGASINSATGAFTWTPTEAQGPGDYTITVRVSDDGIPARETVVTFKVTVNEVNVAPVVSTISNKSVNEGELLSFTASATDSDLPANVLTFSLDAASKARGMVINASTGAFTWTPAEADGPGSYPVTVTVTDNGTPALSGTAQFTIAVRAVNDLSLTLTKDSNPSSADHVMSFTLTATNADPDPGSGLQFTLTLPAGLTFQSTGSTEGCAAQGQVVTCTATSIAANGQASVTVAASYAADVQAGTVFHLTAQLAATEADPKLSNNQAVLDVQMGVKVFLPLAQR